MASYSEEKGNDGDDYTNYNEGRCFMSFDTHRVDENRISEGLH